MAIDTPATIAIIGAGPCGLTAAQDLITAGYPVTIFEAMPVAGGMLRLGVPEYRLPTEIVEREVQDILDLGDLLAEQNGRLNAYLQAGPDGADTLIGIDRDGDGSGFTDAVVRLVGLQISQDDLNSFDSRVFLEKTGHRRKGFNSAHDSVIPSSSHQFRHMIMDLFI